MHAKFQTNRPFPANDFGGKPTLDDKYIYKRVRFVIHKQCASPI